MSKNTGHCERCGDTFVKQSNESKAYFPTKRFCSIACNNKSRSIPLLGRLEKYLWPEPNTGCHLWSGAADRGIGYGRIGIDGKLCLVHRVVYETFVGPIPAGMVVMHRCDQPLCGNPDHLMLGTYADNSGDAKRKGRLPHGEDHKRAKLSTADIRRIRQSNSSYAVLAEQFGVSKSNIGSIITRQTWQHIE